MNSGGSGWQIVESEDYERSVAQAGSHQELDVALGPVIYALYRNPTGFDSTNQPNIHIAKTKIRIFDGGFIPTYRVWFRIDSIEMIVTLLWVELSPPDDMGFGNMFDDDGPLF